MDEITKQDVINWLGSDNTLEEALDTLASIANDDYSGAELERDIRQYNS